MKRFQMDRPIMVKRWRREWENHGLDFGNCHCGAGIGTMRKHRPNEGHGRYCGVCCYSIMAAKQARKRERYGARAMIEEEFSLV